MLAAPNGALVAILAGSVRPRLSLQLLFLFRFSSARHGSPWWALATSRLSGPGGRDTATDALPSLLVRPLAAFRYWGSL